MNETIKYQYDENNDVYVVEIEETNAERFVDGITVREIFEIFEDLVNDWTDEMMKDIELIREITDVLCAMIRVKQYEVVLALMVYGVLPITPNTSLNEKKGDNMIKVLKLTDEEFNSLTDEETFFIEVEEVEVEPDFQAKYTKSELLEEINNIIGVLNIKEAKDFVFKYGSRKNEDEDIYNSLLLKEIINSDELLNKEFKIIIYYYSDSIGTDKGYWEYKSVIGYDLKY